MIYTKFFLNNTEVNPPKNWEEMLIELNYGKDQFPGTGTISITDFDWVRENFDTITKYIQDGLTGDVGIFEGIPLRIEISDGTTNEIVFDGYIDLTDNLNVKDKIRLVSKSVNHSTVDWLNQVASGFTFEYLAKGIAPGSPGYIDASMYRFMPYVNNSVPNYEQAAIATLMVYNIGQALYKEIEEISAIIADAAGFFTTIPAIAKFIIKVAYLTLLVVTLIKLIEDLIKFVISPIKYHAGMLVRDLLNKGAEFLGMTFVSDVWDKSNPEYSEFIIPEKLYNPPSASDSQILGFLKPDVNSQEGFYKGTFAKLLDAMKTKYNAKIVVTPDKKIYLIRKDKNASPPTYVIPDIYQPERTYNTDELQANTLIQYQLDSTDNNTFQDYAGTLYQVICQPKKVNYQPFVLMKHLVTVDIPFARASVKKQLSVPEQIIDNFLTVFDSIINTLSAVANTFISVINSILKTVKKILFFFRIKINIGSIPTFTKVSLAGKIENRIGMMMLQNDHFSIPKIMILKEGSESKYNKIDPVNETVETAKSMWDRFYYVNSFIPTILNPVYSDRPFGNQFMIKTFQNVPFTWSDFIKVLSNNCILDSDGKTAIIESLKFNPRKEFADMKIRFRQIYTLNLQETFLNPTGI